MSFHALYKPALEATIYDSRHHPVTILGGLGSIPDEIVLDYFRDTFATEFPQDYTCEVAKVFEDGSREIVETWALSPLTTPQQA